MDYYDQIYYSLIGQLEDEVIANAFASGSECDQAYTRLLEARNRVQERLGEKEDRDLAQMLTEMNTIQRILCRKIMELRKL